MDKLKMHSPDLTQRNIDAIAELFPTVITESIDEDGNPVRAVDFDLLRQELSDHVVEGPQERYQLDWPGKREALFAANAPIAKTLRPVREESVDFDTTKNLFIEGDNLDALKLLQESYLGKVKLIYIDPPYNTGNDFIYRDDFRESTREYLLRSGQVDEDGTRLVANPESNGRFHSDWLTMMYPRLKLARNLLREDGIICVSIDDHEVDNLTKLMSEVFGRDGFISTLPRVTKRAGKSGDLIAANHDYLVIWGRTRNVSLNRQEHTDAGFKHVDEYSPVRGNYKLNQTLDYGSIQYSRSLDYEIEIDGLVLRPGGATVEEMQVRQEQNPKTGWCWRWSRDLFEFGKRNGFVVVKEGREGPRIYTKTYERATIEKTGDSYTVALRPRTRAFTSLDLTDNRFSNDGATKGIRSLFGYTAFDYTKPVELLTTIIEMATNPQSHDIVVDLFAGSGTTGHAVHAANANDNGNRRFILVQLDELVDSSSDAASRGFTTISELSRERLRLASHSVSTSGTLATPNADVDLGFRALRVDSSCFKPIPRPTDQTTQTILLDGVETILPDRTEDDLMFEVLIRWGLDLSSPLSRESILGQTVLTALDGDVMAIFEFTVSMPVLSRIAALRPLRVVLRSSAFKDDAQRINVEQLFSSASKETDVSVV